MLNEYIKCYFGFQVFISLFYIICVDEEFYKNLQFIIYDVQVFVDDFMCVIFQFFVVNLEYVLMLKEVIELDGQFGCFVQVIVVLYVKYFFFNLFSEDFVIFICNWLSFQKRDFDIIFGEIVRSGVVVMGDEWCKGGKDSIWVMLNVWESVNVFLLKYR